MQNPRYLAYKALLKVECDGAYSNLTLDSFLKSSDLDSRSCALAASLFYGVLERKLSLDYIIKRFSTVRLKKIEIKTLIILRMGIYQIVFMDKIPESAAVNESVKICRREKLHHSSGFVNGVLRSICRAEEKFPLPDKGDMCEYLSVKYSCPKEIIRLWADDYSIDTAGKILKELSGRPPIFARVNTLKTTRQQLITRLEAEGCTAYASQYSEAALELENFGTLTNLPSFREGLFHVQDLSSQICCETLAPGKGDVISDVCSAPGGKAFTIAQLLDGTGEVHCHDIHEHKISLIKNGAERLGLKNIDASVRDALSDEPLCMSDKILCDVPCSGLGILRRKPEIRYKNDMGLDTLPDVQYKILENSAKYLKPCGVLVYSTCTLHKAENDDVIDRFLSEHHDFEPYPLKLPSGVEHITDEPDNRLTLFPFALNTDGFFISAVKKR